MEGDPELQPRGPIEGERFVVLDDMTTGVWYTFECTDDEIVYAPFARFEYSDMARKRGGIHFCVRMANGRIKRIWSGHLRAVYRD